jgi:peptidoglycan-associated lipoprotein
MKASGTPVKIQIEGHCDERGSNEYNLALGEKRARAIQDALVAEGVAASSVTTISYGEERPAVEGQDEAAFSKNRRGEFKKL